VSWSIYATVAQNLLAHVAALHGCHYQGIFTAVELVFSKWFVVWAVVTSVQECDCAAYSGPLRKHYLTAVKTPWWWHPWSVETRRRRFC